MPATALITKDEVTFCYRVEDGKAVRTPVRVGIWDGEAVEVLKKQAKPDKPGSEGVWEDFTGDEEIVLGNVGSLTNGQTLTPVAGKESK